MKKTIDLKKIALMGITGGVLIAQSQVEAAYNANQSYTTDAVDTSMQKSASKTMTEQDLLSQLNAEGKATYQGLDKEGKALALKLANQSCKGQNECKGLNSCKTEDNSCAGKGSCKGTSPGPFKDKNAAVKAAAKHMAEKRSMMK